MQNQTTMYHVIGVMSGTSLDGIDLAECRFQQTEDGKWNYQLGACITLPYPKYWQERLQNAVLLSKTELHTLDKDYTAYLSSVIGRFILENKLENVDAVCSHGHTVHHRPDQGFTFQIGNLPELASIAGQKVVCDFRKQDVALGGQGAPLVPIGDHFLFREYDYCLNLGGFANCSFYQDRARLAYDICPVNIVLNIYARQLGAPYDENGLMARRGKVDPHLKKALDELPYYHLPAPKSLGYEWVKEVFLPVVERYALKPKDTLATLSTHITGQLTQQFKAGSTVLVTGGGAHNSFLIESIGVDKGIRLVKPEAELIEFKEALIFGFLGVLKLEGKPNCLSSVTGAVRDHSSGMIYNAN